MPQENIYEAQTTEAKQEMFQIKTSDNSNTRDFINELTNLKVKLDLMLR